MPRYKHLFPLKRKNFDFPVSVFNIAKNLRDELECSSISEIASRSYEVCVDRYQRNKDGWKLASKNGKITPLEEPAFPVTEERRRINLVFTQKMNQELVQTAGEQRCSEVEFISKSILLVDRLRTNIVHRNIVGYAKCNGFQEVVYELLIPAYIN